MSVSSNQQETPFDVLPGLIWAAGPDGVCSYFNRRWLEFRGRTLEQEQGDGWTQGIHSEDVERRVAAFREAFRQRKPFHSEYRLRCRDGSYRWVADEAGPVFENNGELTGFAGCCVPISGPRGEVVAAEAPTRAKYAEALPLLAGIMAHEFNNLLTPILLNLSMAQSQLSGYSEEVIEEVNRRLFETEAAAIRAKELSTHLLAFGKGGNPVKETVDPAPLVEEAVAKALAGSNGITATFRHGENLRRLDVDREQFDAVIDRIIENAIAAMPSGGAVHVSTELVEHVHDPKLKRLHGPHICFRIEDEGNGIRFDAGDRIFDPYFSTRPGAEGLGLTTAQVIVRNHSGEIIAESESGHGAAFRIYLPVAAAPAERKREEAKPARTTSVRGQGRVLIMDDEDLVRSSVAAILKAYGYEVETARDGAEALEAYVKARETDNPIDCALMDLTIHGGMGGKEAMGRLKQIDPEAKGIVCSGHSNDLIMDKFGMYGFRAAIKKPFQPDELNRVLQELIHS